MDLRVASQALKELAELMDCSATIGGADEDDDSPDKSDPFAPPSDDDFDSADFWKK